MDLTCLIDEKGQGRRIERRAGWSRALVPDLALMLALFTLLYCLFFFDGTQKLFRDSDTGWHIRTGEILIDGGSLPRTDPYSLLRSGQPWFAWEWGADLLMVLAHRAGGLAGVAWMFAAVIAVCTWLWVRLHWAVDGSFLGVCAMASLMHSTANMHWLARPHVFGWLLLLGWLLYLEREHFKTSHWIFAAAFGAVWANVHASFFLAPALALIYGTSRFLRPLIWNIEREPEWRRAKALLLIAAGAALGTLVNPYGWQLHVHVLMYLADRELLDRIGEFQSFNFHAEGSAQIVATVVLTVGGALLALGQRRVARCLTMLLFTVIALRSARALPIVALVCLPLANGAITEALGFLGGLRPRIRRGLDGILRYSENLRAIDRGLNGWLTAGVLIAISLAWTRLPNIAARAGFPASDFPVLAAAHIPEGARLLAPDKFGGYLIYRFQGRLKVFFDGRSDFYGSQYMKDYLDLIELRAGWRDRVENIGFTHALLPDRYSLIPALEQIGWRRVYKDNTATLLARPGL